MPLTNPNIEPALEVLRKTGHTVAAPTLHDGIVYVVVDNMRRPMEEVFKMVEDYIRQRARKAAF